MKNAVYCLCVMSVFCVAGCGAPVAVAPKVNATAAILKPRLEGIAASGFVGSSGAGMKEAIEELPADVAAGLLKDYEELMKAKSQKDVKAIATRMVEKL